jgi:hypothetical protein
MKGFANLNIIWGGLLSLGNLGYYFFTRHQYNIQQAALDSGDVSTRRARAIKTFLQIVDDTTLPAMLFIVCGLLFTVGGVLLSNANKTSRWVLYAAVLLTIVVFTFFILPQSTQLAYLAHFRKNGESADGSEKSLLLICGAAVLLLAFPLFSIIWLLVKKRNVDGWLGNK